MALSGRLGGRGLRARRPEDPAPRRLFLPDHRGRRHGGPADRPHGDRRALEIDPRPMGALPAQSARAHDRASTSPGGRAGMRRWSKDRPAIGGWSITATRTASGTLGRQTLLEPIEWTADGWFRATRRRSVTAACQAARRHGRTRGLCAVRRLYPESVWDAVELLRARTR